MRLNVNILHSAIRDLHDSAVKFLTECGEMPVDEDDDNSTLSLMGEDDVYNVSFDKVRSDGKSLQFHVCDGGGYCRKGTWLNESDFPGYEYLYLIEAIEWNG